MLEFIPYQSNSVFVYVPLEGLVAVFVVLVAIMFGIMHKVIVTQHRKLNDRLLDWNTPLYERRCHFCGKRITEVGSCKLDSCSFDPSYDELFEENIKLRDKDKWRALEESI